MKDSIYFPIVFLIGGVVCLYIGMTEMNEANALERSGLTVQSLPLTTYTEEIKRGTVSGHEISPEFMSQSGMPYKCTARVTKSMISTLADNPIVSIKYLPQNPKVCEVIGENNPNFMMLIFIGIIAFFGSLFGLYKHYRMS